jgi:hypothetical protein
MRRDVIEAFRGRVPDADRIGVGGEGRSQATVLANEDAYRATAATAGTLGSRHHYLSAAVLAKDNMANLATEDLCAFRVGIARVSVPSHFVVDGAINHSSLFAGQARVC